MSKKTLSLVSGPPKVPKNGFLLLNRLESILGNKDEEAAASHVASQKFIQLMLDEIQKFGYGFVPFVGAGFSVSSGIPILNQFHHYLQRCICVAVGAEADSDTPHLWNPRTDRWPPFIDLSRPEPPDRPWAELVETRWKKEISSGSFKSAIYQEALGAMAEWRSSLYFLSRLDLDPPRKRPTSPSKDFEPGSSVRQDEAPEPVLRVPSQDVIDECLRQVLRANVPSLNHIMLATLSQLLRIDIILTTNFDDLTEKAFEQSRNKLEVFDVHLGDKLPDFNAVSRVRSIVKINGSQNSLRADFSLDGPPPIEDRMTFTSYVAGRDCSKDTGREKDTDKDKHNGGVKSRNHLLIFGVSVNERRTKEFLAYALDKLHDLKLFFVCYQHSDIRAVETFASSYFNDSRFGAQRRRWRLDNEQRIDNAAVFVVLRHTEAGLLLLHTYQWFRKSLPQNDAVSPPSLGSLCRVFQLLTFLRRQSTQSFGGFSTTLVAQ